MSVPFSDFDPVPSWASRAAVSVTVRSETSAPEAGPNGAIIGMPVGIVDGELDGVRSSQEAARAVGFDGKVGQTFVCEAPDGHPAVLYGIGDPAEAEAADLRAAAAAFSHASARRSHLVLATPERTKVAPEQVAKAMVEGVLLARYRTGMLKALDTDVSVAALELLVRPADLEAASRGARRGEVYARATALARDLANSPPSLLTAERMADCATELGAQAGLEIEVFDRQALVELGCGGLLGVNAGSAEEPRMIKLRYVPKGGDPAAPRVTLVGKGIMYDSGGISLKPSDSVHATMKNDMSGAGAILAMMAVLPELDCPTVVTGYLMCTDNMPSGTATKLGDVLRIRGGKTVEVINTDAEGRLVMADALVLATEEPTDAIVDIATLTGACLRALGPEIAGVFGNNQALVDQVLAASQRTGEAAWQLPLATRYRDELDSEIADIKNMGGPNAGAIHAALFLAEFVGDVAWAHLDIAGTAQAVKPAGWQTAGCTGFGTALLLDLATAFSRPTKPPSDGRIAEGPAAYAGSELP